jgi:hypothetical protein
LRNTTEVAQRPRRPNGKTQLRAASTIGGSRPVGRPEIPSLEEVCAGIGGGLLIKFLEGQPYPVGAVLRWRMGRLSKMAFWRSDKRSGLRNQR